MRVFGPVPSRRLGRSLGVNNIPYKHCTYSCVYCQLGRTKNLEVRRREFYSPEEIISEVSEALRREIPDYVTFVPDGEPTLDRNIGKEILGIKDLGAKVAVLTNSSLLFSEEVRKDIEEADLVSIKLDSLEESEWKEINRPHPSLSLERILDGIEEFSKDFRGKLISETMIFEGRNLEGLSEVASFLAEIGVEKAYISAPVRPPAEKWIKMPSEREIVASYEIFRKSLGERVEVIARPEPPGLGHSGDFYQDVLSISSVHPIREDMMRDLMRKDGASDEDLKRLIVQGKISEVEYEGKKYYVRKFKL